MSPGVAPVQRSVLGLPVHVNCDYAQWLVDQLRQGRGVHVVTINAEMAMAARTDEQLRSIIQNAGLVIPDGAGVVWALGLTGQKVPRTPGIELVEQILPKLIPTEKVYLLGAKPGYAERVAQQWQIKFPNLKIAGYRDGYFRPEEEDQVLEQIVKTLPSLVLVGLGVPRQEYLIQQWRRQLPQSLWIGVGGSFDIWAGTKERAPQFFRDNSLEWLYRLYQEPYRWRRMLALPHFALTVLAEGVKR